MKTQFPLPLAERRESPLGKIRRESHGKTVHFLRQGIWSVWRRHGLCGDTDEPVCSNCVDELTPLSPTERAERALATGRALYPDERQKFLNRERIQQAKKQARLERAHQAIRTDKTCLRCGGPMEKYGTKIFHLAMRSAGSGSKRRAVCLLADSRGHSLRQCGKAEFYLPEPPELPNIPDEEEEPVTCPVCGTRHSPLIGCPNCAMKQATSPRSRNTQTGTKPPWEK